MIKKYQLKQQLPFSSYFIDSNQCWQGWRTIKQGEQALHILLMGMQLLRGQFEIIKKNFFLMDILFDY